MYNTFINVFLEYKQENKGKKTKACLGPINGYKDTWA